MKKTLIKILVALVAVIILISLVSGFIIDFQWFKEVGYLGVFFTSLKTKVILFIPAFLIILLLINSYARFLKKSYIKLGDTIYSKSDLKLQGRIINIASLVLSFFLSLTFTNIFWYRILEFLNAKDFGAKDPIFNIEAGFYVFKLPLIKAVLGMMIAIVIIMIAITLLFFSILKFKDGFSGFAEYMRGQDNPQIKFVTRQLSIFGAVLLILLSGVFYLRGLNLVYSPRGVAFGASYTDVHVSLFMYRMIAVFCIISAFVIAYSIIKHRIKWIVYTAIFIVVLMVSETVISFGVEKFIVSPNARDKEMPYLTYNIEATRDAFGLNRIVERDFAVDNNLTKQDVDQNKATIDNIRINEFSQSLEVFNQIQAIRNYYRFTDVDIDRYVIDNNLRQVFIAARELDNSNREAKFQTWQNRHLFYTHGYGAVMTYTNIVNSSGLPEFILRDIPAVGNAVKLDKPQIYFGELNDDYIIVGAKSNEIDYPSGNENKENRYDGTAGIRMSAFNRWLFTVNYGEMNFLLSNDINANSKIILNRDIMARVKKIAPFLNYDRDPYLVASNGRLYWMIDAYTTTDRYPYSEPHGGINYIRNSIKVVVDAYDGKVDFYLADPTDAIAKTIGSIYGGIFKDISQMPVDLRSHLRYSEDVFSIQSTVFEKYHMENSTVFYNSEDLWDIAKYKGSDNAETNVQPVYQVMRLPGETDEEFLLTIPFTVAKKENMVSWLAVKMNNNQSQMVLIRFPKDRAVYGPQQFDSRINTDTSVSSLKTLLGQQGSKVIMGETCIIPINNSLIYVRPLYLRADSEKSLPELKKVIVGFGDRIVMEDNIQNAFARLFNVNVETPAPGTTPTQPGAEGSNDTKALVARAADLFNKAKAAQTSGDWAAYGQYLKELETVINQLQETTK